MTTTTLPMLDAHPDEITLDAGKLAAAIDALTDCAQTCTACADACLSESSVSQLTTCVRQNLDCADVCATTARVLSRHTGSDATVSRALLQACVTACRSCGAECAVHADAHQHCRICAEACQRCAQACDDLSAVLS